MDLCQPYYIEKRKGEGHLSLNGEWEFCWKDQAQDDVESISFDYKTQLPSDVLFSLHNAGVLPHPYQGMNSKEYHWVDEKVWYYRKHFSLDKKGFNGNAYLCFDGISYYSRVWVNGSLVGRHEGMFGGPIVDVFDHLVLDGENEILVEVSPATTEWKDTFYTQNRRDGTATQIIPWDTIRSYATPDYVLIGIWNDIRIEFLDKIHLSRPSLVTKKIDKKLAIADFEVEIASPDVKELHESFGDEPVEFFCSWSTMNGLTGLKKESYVTVEITLTEKDTQKVAYTSCDQVNLLDYAKQLTIPEFNECQFFKKQLIITNPKLWYPTGLGEPYLYAVDVILKFQDAVVDELHFDYGIRIFETDHTDAEKFKSHTEKYKFSINGKDFFLKGMNWMPIDQQYNFSREEYKWTLMLVKNAGIQLIRVWNGGGLPETDDFYELCDELGIMVWQDHFICNTSDTSSFPKRVLESQASMNVYRIRNHPSLVIHCMGNEFNPYSSNNAASMFTSLDVVRALDNDKVVYYTTPDGGSAHIYRDFEPVWYRHCYQQLPFVGESGIHSFPNFKTFKSVISGDEAERVLTPLDCDAFINDFPEIVNHFVEYEPRRTIRLLSRISQITDLSVADLEAYCEASHVQAYEFYQIMAQALLENYPVCGGLMPWVFRRPFTAVAIQMVDGGGRPILPYYAIQNAYQSVSAFLQLEWNLLYPGESMPLKVNIADANNTDLFGAFVTVSIFDSNMNLVLEKNQCVQTTKRQYDFGCFDLDDRFTNTCFLVNVRLEKNGSILSDNTYFPRCLEEFNDRELLESHRQSPKSCMRRKNGPFVKDTFTAAPKGTLRSTMRYIGEDSFGYSKFAVSIQNTGKTPIYPITVDCEDDTRFFADNNFFLLKEGEQRTITITTDSNRKALKVIVSAWNSEDSFCET